MGESDKMRKLRKLRSTLSHSAPLPPPPTAAVPLPRRGRLFMQKENNLGKHYF